jgi:hypothetical protein
MTYFATSSCSFHRVCIDAVFLCNTSSVIYISWRCHLFRDIEWIYHKKSSKGSKRIHKRKDSETFCILAFNFAISISSKPTASFQPNGYGVQYNTNSYLLVEIGPEGWTPTQQPPELSPSLRSLSRGSCFYFYLSEERKH